MNIITENKRLLYERVGGLDKPKAANAVGRGMRLLGMSDAIPNSLHLCSPNIESLLTKINTATSMDKLPDIIKFDYTELERNNIPAKDINDVISICYDLAAARLNTKRKNVVLSGFVHAPLGHEYATSLIENNFAGCGFSVKGGGIEHLKDFNARWSHDNSIWAEGTITGRIITKKSTPIVIELTFRQKQVAHLIKNRGLTNKQIAKELTISEQAVKIHVSLILKKYGVKTRTQLALAMGEKW